MITIILLFIAFLIVGRAVEDIKADHRRRRLEKARSRWEKH